ncbi:MAG TPA: ATP-dependent protease [Gammaproteobacteria bacterium]|nr:ATP-dependent protease [Gammaproteobacteria bacterium]
MSLAVVYSRAGVGIDAPLVTVEVHVANGLPGLSIVGLPEAAVKESKDRVRGAIINSNFEFPAKKIIINLAPADLPKEGGRFDLPIAIGILLASGQLEANHIENYEFVGELALGGDLRVVKGVIPIAMQTRGAARKLVLPVGNESEAGMLRDVTIIPAAHLVELCQHLNGSKEISAFESTPFEPSRHFLDMSDIKGQSHAKRALEICAGGGHSLLMVGPPGTGKTMLASRLPGILPNMSELESAESAAIQSISAQGFDYADWGCRTFRAPHHTASSVALVGGGGNPKPGEISLAHHGVLFLDELPEFGRQVLEVLREPLESGYITISRAARQAEFPAKFQLIAAMNPCPCGYHGDSSGKCHCSEEKVQRYRNKISGPLLDRIDMHIEVPRVAKLAQLSKVVDKNAEVSETIQQRVRQTRHIQNQRIGKCNAQMSVKEIALYCELGEQESEFLSHSIEKLNLSSRAYHRILKVARTIADMQGKDRIELPHVAEAIGFRRFDRVKA